MPGRVGSFALREAADGFIAATEDGFHFVDPETGEFRVVDDFLSDDPDTRCNDGNAIRPAASGPARWT